MSYFASYYKCALQVNPSSYASFRGKQVSEETAYNEEVLQKCQENNIEVVGLANHGNVDSSESLRELLENNGITVFPGFEIMSAEKIHMVCLYPENRTVSQLNRYLGAMGLDTSVRGNETSSLTCLQIAKKVLDEGGFWYAAHITSDNGILKIGKLNTVWQSDLLVAAQIPDSKENIDPKYKNIINNTDPQYKRLKSPAYINACDIEKPKDLDKDSATTLIKMSEPSFKNFTMAFKDPDSRIRLNSEVEINYQSAIRSLKVFGGYLDGLNVEFSDNLVTIIGGRGTGKSTIINFIRYALDMPPKERLRKKDYDEMIENNLGTTSRIELTIESNAQYGRVYRIIKRYNATPVIEDADGKVSDLKIEDILPSIEIYGQNEIVESVRNPELINNIVLRLFSQDASIRGQINLAYHNLTVNSSAIAKAEEAIEMDEGEAADLPTLMEKLRYYEEAGIDKKVPLIEELAGEETLLDTFGASIPKQELELIELTEDSLDGLPELAELAKEYNQRLRKIKTEYDELIKWVDEQFSGIKGKWEIKKTGKEDEIRKSLESIEGIHDKSATEIVADYSKLLKKVKKAEPISKRLEDNRKKIEELESKRLTLIEICRKSWDAHVDDMSRQLKKLNKKKLGGAVRLSINFMQQKDSLIERLLRIDGIGEKSIAGIVEYNDFDAFTFADDLRKGAEHIKEKYHLTSSSAEKIVRGFSVKDIRSIEELIFPDQFAVELLVNGKYKPMKNLSKGQQCTAILHIILLDNKDPLIVDQPEDNLDNSFIAEDLIAAIRDNKIRRQYIFATHNANIPVFGDAELIVSMEEKEGNGAIIEGGLGSVDTETVKAQVIRILEGGEAAFKMREEKYGL